MANDKKYDRHINIWINGKEVKNDLASMEKELYKMRKEWKRMEVGTQEWLDKGNEIKKLKGIVDEHNASIRKTPGLLDKIKGSFGMITGVIAGAVAGFESLRGIIEATDNLSDKFNATLGGMKEGLMSVKQAIATGDLTNFFKNLADAYSEGKRYAETLDAIGDSARALTLEESKIADRILELKIIMMDATKSREEQIAAGEETERLQAQLAEKRVTQAKKNLENEMSNARQRSKLTDEEIRGLLDQDEAYMKLLETGQKYTELQNKLKLMQAGTVTPYGTVISASQDEIKKVAQEIENMGMVGEYASRVYVGWSNIVEDQREKLVQYEVDVADARRSATEDILRQITRLNSARASEAEQAKKSVEQIQAYYEKYGLNEAEAREPGAAYNPEEFMRLEEEELRRKAKEQEEKDNDKKVKDEEKRQEAYLKSLDEGTEAARKEWEERRANEKESLDEMLMYYMNYAEAVGAELGKAIAEGDNLLKAAAKQMLLFLIDELAKKAKVYEAEAIIKNIVAYGPIAGTIRAAAITLAIETALGAARAVVMKNLWTGGYTGSGGKYEPKGIVHGGEWVASAGMVQNPRTGAIIAALENERQRTRGFADGGYVPASTSPAAGQSGQVLQPQDPRLISLMIGIERLLAKLDSEGVKTVWGYNDVHKVRKGLEKLGGIEDAVSR